MLVAGGKQSGIRGPSGLGPVGRVARVVVGILFVYLALFWRDPDWIDPVLGLVAMPGAVLAGILLWTRRRPQPIRATGPLGHAVNLAVLIPLFALPATAGASFLFYGASMLVAAANRGGACEVTAVSNALLGRDDEVGCPLFGPLDAVEAWARARALGVSGSTAGAAGRGQRR